MALPTSRDITILAGSSQIPANLLNNLQDQIIGAKHPSRNFYYHPIVLPGTANFSYASPPQLQSTANPALGVIVLPTTEGDRITACSFRAKGNTVTDATTNLYVCAQDMVTTTLLGTVTDNNRAAVWADVALGAFATHVMAAGEFLYLDLNANGAAYFWGRIKLTKDRL